MFLQDNALLSVACTSVPLCVPVNISCRDPGSTPVYLLEGGKVHRQGEVEKHRVSWVTYRMLILNPSLFPA